MNRIVAFLIFLALSSTQKVIAQDIVDKKELSQLLVHYYQIKNALVTGDAQAAASASKLFIKTLNMIDYKVISEGNSNTLLKDASHISDEHNIQRQRSYFANFSENMVLLAKARKMSTETVYHMYCETKKLHWLDSEKKAKNPYSGIEMSNCNILEEIIQ